jgi:hypothetical protein
MTFDGVCVFSDHIVILGYWDMSASTLNQMGVSWDFDIMLENYLVISMKVDK